jgi:hypothetical protein
MTWLSAAAVGMLGAGASLFKQTALMPIIAVAAIYVNAPAWRKRLPRMALVMTVPVLSWLAIAAYFAADGRFTDFYAAVFGYNSSYMRHPGQTALEALEPHRLAFLVAACLPALVALIARSQERKSVPAGPYGLTLAFAIATAAQVALPGQWHSHYYQLWTPALALSLATGIALLRYPRRPWLADVAGAVVLLPLVVVTAAQFRLTPQEWSLRKHGLEFVATEGAARELRRALLPGETFYQLGSHPGLYVETRQAPPTGMFYLPVPRGHHPLSALEHGPMIGERTRQTIAELQKSPPDMLVLGMDALQTLPRVTHLQQHPLMQWFARQYAPLPEDPNGGYFKYYAKLGTGVAARNGITIPHGAGAVSGGGR